MKTCSFFGHRNTQETPELCNRLRTTILHLINEKNVEWFLFGSKSAFDDLCLKTVTELQETYPTIKRMYVRSQNPYIPKTYQKYLLELYDDTIFPSRVKNAGRASYVERNQAMIEASDFCVFYYNAEYKPPLRKHRQKALSTYQPASGTKLAYEYALQKKKEIINLYPNA